MEMAKAQSRSARRIKRRIVHVEDIAVQDAPDGCGGEQPVCPIRVVQPLEKQDYKWP
jgi:hypothetical protein